MIVLDASCLVELATQTADAARIERRLAPEAGRICAPQVIDLEVLSALRNLVVGRQIDLARADRALELLTLFPMRRYSHRRLHRRVWELRDNLSAYDAAYVAVAERLHCPLLTRDARLARAPGLGDRIELI